VKHHIKNLQFFITLKSRDNGDFSSLDSCGLFLKSKHENEPVTKQTAPKILKHLLNNKIKN
jgi:hypothetical protein